MERSNKKIEQLGEHSLKIKFKVGMDDDTVHKAR